MIERNLPTLDDPNYKTGGSRTTFFPLVGTAGAIGEAPRIYGARPLCFYFHEGQNGRAYRLKFQILESSITAIEVKSVWEFNFSYAEKADKRAAQMGSLNRFICAIMRVKLTTGLQVDPLRNTLLDLSDNELLGTADTWDFKFSASTARTKPKDGSASREVVNFYPVV